MKVLFITRPTVFSGPGGDTVQLQNTAAALAKFGVDVHLSESIKPSLDGFDLVHFFNLRNPQDLLHNVRRVKKAGIPSVLSTIWGSYLEGDRATRNGLQGFISKNFSEHSVEYAKAMARVLVNGNFHSGMLQYFLAGHLTSQKEICKSVDVLLPNSPTELARVRDDMSVPGKAGVVVNNAVNSSIFSYDDVFVTKEFEKYNGFVVSAARIEPRKCQLELIKACNLINQPLLVVGRPSPNSAEYYRKCKEVAGSNIHFLEQVDHTTLAQIFKACSVHALVSWMETPGLSSLEAGAMGCNLVVTEKGDTRFYFGENAEYVDPASVESIAQGLLRAIKRNPNPEFRHQIVNEFNWVVTAKQTLDGYKLALNKWNDS